MLYGVRLAQLGIPANTNQIYQHNELALGIHEVILSSLLLSLQVTALDGLATHPKSNNTSYHIVPWKQ